MSEQYWPPVVGIDADTKGIAWCWLNGTLGQVQWFPRELYSGVPGRYRERLKEMMHKASWLGATIYLEDIFFNKKAHIDEAITVFRGLARVQGELLYEAEFWSIPVVAVPVYEWRMGVFGASRGRAVAKDMAMQKAKTICPNNLNEHEAEAVCIALYAAQQESLRRKLKVGA